MDRPPNSWKYVNKSIFADCYEDLKPKLSPSSNAFEIAAAVLQWHVEHQRLAPSPLQMQTFIIKIRKLMKTEKNSP
jgi:recombinational DNA repair protein (RecF pathway)